MEGCVGCGRMFSVWEEVRPYLTTFSPVLTLLFALHPVTDTLVPSKTPRTECTIGDDGFAVCHTSVSLEDGDGSSGVGVAAAAAVSAASARAWASAASQYQVGHTH